MPQPVREGNTLPPCLFRCHGSCEGLVAVRSHWLFEAKCVSIDGHVSFAIGCDVFLPYFVHFDSTKFCAFPCSPGAAGSRETKEEQQQERKAEQKQPAKTRKRKAPSDTETEEADAPPRKRQRGEREAEAEGDESSSDSSDSESEEEQKEER